MFTLWRPLSLFGMMLDAGSGHWGFCYLGQNMPRGQRSECICRWSLVRKFRRWTRGVGWSAEYIL